ncbi:MAG: DNA-processing protein DprA [Ruminococcus sp.]|nr:DNA-processing protein DprA [Ruminococcus sp.]
MGHSEAELTWVMLSIMFSAPNRRLWEVLSNYSSAQELYDDIVHFRCGYMSSDELARANSCSENQGLAVLKSCKSKGISLLTYDDERYPKRLRCIACPPAVLYCKGDISALSREKSIAVIGARKASDYSLKVAARFSYALAASGISIISGLANGIDQQAHMSSIEAGGITCAVLGCGIDYDYPYGSAALKEDIAEHGVVISEYFPLARPAKENFRERNRLVSALSDGVLVVQAGLRSGTLNTVNHALEQSKEVFVIPPHDILSADYISQSELIRDGANEVYLPEQIIESI